MEQLKTIILERRKLLKMTQKDLAVKLNVSDKVISKWETGVSLPDITLLNPLAEALDISVSELLNAKELTTPLIDDKEDHVIITKYKIIDAVAVGLFILSIISALVIISIIANQHDTLELIMMILAIIFIVIGLLVFIMNQVWFRSTYIRYFYRKPYDQIYYKHNLIVMDIITSLLLVLVLQFYNIWYLTISLVMISLITGLLKVVLVKHTLHNISNKKYYVVLASCYIIAIFLMHVVYIFGLNWISLMIMVLVYISTTGFMFYRLKYIE